MYQAFLQYSINEASVVEENGARGFLEERLLKTATLKSEKLSQTEIKLENYEKKQEKITSLGLR